MNTSKILLRLSMCFLVGCLFACASDDTKTSTIDSSTIESTELGTRGMEAKVQSKAYYFKSLAAFENGTSVIAFESLSQLEGKEFNFVVLYGANASWANVFNTGDYSITGNEELNGLMKTYQLEIVDQFEIDEENEGIVLEPIASIPEPLEVARKLSLVDEVLMVQLKEVPKNKEVVTSTAENN